MKRRDASGAAKKRGEVTMDFTDTTQLPLPTGEE
jgi:hypothetical protein